MAPVRRPACADRLQPSCQTGEMTGSGHDVDRLDALPNG
jgi:hypothetical protein